MLDMHILVTGINGFTGQYVKASLEKSGHKLIALTSNLTDASAVKKEVSSLQIDAVIHLAAIAFVGHGDVNELYNVNLLGTLNLLQALSQISKPVQHVLLASSANIYGNSSKGMLDETTPANPANDYAVSKYAMELMAQLWSSRLPISLLRPFNYTGVGQDSVFLIPKIVDHFKARKPVIELGNLDVWREFNDVRFVAESYTKLITQIPEKLGQAINICTGKAYSLREVIALCEQITSHKIEIHVNPQFVRDNEVKVLKGDNSLLKKMTGNTSQYDLERTLRWMLE
ncbi:MAG TPA: NAD-dependent epimerase/dehydratase family protein [Methylococcales bacterium]|nr:NAD-dependent epimerase/dehydratase family protein [Methylococcales bacterium]